MTYPATYLPTYGSTVPTTLFYSAPTAVADFTDGSPVLTNVLAGEGVAYSATGGPANASQIVVTTATGTSTGGQEVGVRASGTNGSGRSASWYFMVPAGGVLTNASVTNTLWSNSGTTSANYGPTFVQVGITQGRTQSGTTGTTGAYRLFMQTALDSYAVLYYGGTQLVRGTWYRIEVRMSDDQIILWVTDPGTGIQDAQCYVRGSNNAYFRGIQNGAVSFGKMNSTSGRAYGYAGTLNFAQVGLYSLATPVQSSTPTTIFADLWNGKKSRDLRHDGAIVRHMGYAAGSTGDGGYGYASTGGSDIVSEGQAYGALCAVQAGDQTSANLIFNFAYTTLCRRNTAVATAQNNGTIAGQTTGFAPNLMGFKYQDDIGGFFDANPAADGDNDMMKAYFLAHGRFSSSALTPGAAGESVSINYLQRGINVARDLQAKTFTAVVDAGVTYQVQSADCLSGLNELNPSYLDPWSCRLAAQYDTANATFWNQAIAGAYYILYKNRAQDSYTGPTEWTSLSGTTIQTDTGRGTAGLTYGYNAFRTLHRVNWDLYFYAETKANSYLAGPLRTSSTAEWNSLSLFPIEKANDGSPLTTANGGGSPAAYDKTANTYGQYITQKIGTPTTIAPTIKTNKLNWSVLYQPSENGAYVQDTMYGIDSYFMNYWGMFSYATDTGILGNYSSSTVNRRTGMTIDALLNSSVATRSSVFSLDSSLLKTLKSALSLDSYLTKISPTKQTGFTTDASLKATIYARLTLDALLTGSLPGTPTSITRLPAVAVTLINLIQTCQSLTGNKEPDSEVLLKSFINLAQKDVEKEFSDHPGLQASGTLSLVPGQDVGYAFPDDFREERFLRIVSPIQLSRPLRFVEYTQFRSAIFDLALLTSALPAVWYWAPESPMKIHVYPVPDQAYTVQYDYVRYAPDLINDSDVCFIDRLYVNLLCTQALFYYYNSDLIAKPAQGAQCNAIFLNDLHRLKKSYQRRQLDSVRVPYGTGVNEGTNSEQRYIAR